LSRHHATAKESPRVGTGNADSRAAVGAERRALTVPNTAQECAARWRRTPTAFNCQGIVLPNRWHRSIAAGTRLSM